MMIMVGNKDIRKIVCKFTGGCTIEKIGPSAEKEQETLQKAEAASPPKPTSTLPSPTSPGQTTPSSPIERETVLVFYRDGQMKLANVLLPPNDRTGSWG
jgi:hypothetical protein